MKELFLPVLHSFENNNIFTGSCGDLRYKITPNIVMATQKEVNIAASSMKAEYWHGPCRYEKSEIEGERVFPLSPEGRDGMLAWLNEQL
jgi:hypothetical protein